MLWPRIRARRVAIRGARVSGERLLGWRQFYSEVPSSMTYRLASLCRRVIHDGPVLADG